MRREHIVSVLLQSIADRATGEDTGTVAPHGACEIDLHDLVTVNVTDVLVPWEVVTDSA